MAVKFFGQFLLERGVIGRDQLLDAVAYQESKNLKLGDYAVAKGYLTAEQLVRLNEEQKRTDMRIGELAVLMGMLSRTRLEELLVMQKNDHIMIGEAFVRRGILTSEIIERELIAFHEDQKLYAQDKATESTGNEAVRAAIDMTVKMFQRVAHIEAKVGPGEPDGIVPSSSFSAVSIMFSGDIKVEYILCTTRELSKRIAAVFIGADTASEEELKDGVREFCNIVCGNVMAVLARKGKAVDISPPKDRAPGEDVSEGLGATRYSIATTVLGEQALIIVR